MKKQPPQQTPINVEFRDGQWFEKSVSEVVVPDVEETVKEVLPEQPKIKGNVDWRGWLGWWLAAFSWAFFVTYVLLGVNI